MTLETKVAALSLWQPWATLIAQGHKEYETRSWYTTYRGELLICAAQKKLSRVFYDRLSTDLFDDPLKLQPEDCPRGVAIAYCTLANCIRMTEDFINQQNEKELLVGDWKPGRYAWKLEDIKPVNHFLVKGQQGIFWVSNSLLTLAGGGGV